jgi:hypothetical protein
LKTAVTAILSMAFLTACASKIMDYEKADDLKKNEAYEKKIQVKQLPPEPAPVEATTAAIVEGSTAVVSAPPPKLKSAAKAAKKKPEAPKKAEKHMPEIEDAEGFSGRRPIVDPYRVGEKVTLSLTYFNMTAGYLDLEVLPFVEVNGKRSYTFRIMARSNSLFSRFYAVDDQAITYVDYDTLLPFNFHMSIKETKQLGDIRTFFDWKKLKGSYWAKKVHKDKGERNKEFEWDIKSHSQNVVSAIFYLRAFTLTPGKKLQFRVADDGKNVVFSGEVLRREEIETEIGKLKTVVVKPTLQVDGVFKPVGDIFIWLTDDDRKYVVRLESKIKIGTLVGKLKSIEPGR